VGDDFNNDPLHRSARYVINLSDLRNEEDLEPYVDLAAIVREKVKPVRDALGGNPNNIPLKRRWWAYQAHRPEFYGRLETMRRFLAICRTTQCFAFSFLFPGSIFSEGLVLIALDQDAAFATLQSRVHEGWARFFSSTMGDALRYTPSDCFETFPFPENWETHPALEPAGKAYYEFRAALMVKSNEGLTRTSNRFHDPDKRDPEIAKLRELHAAMDRAVLDAYGWTDIPIDCEFLLDYEIDEEEWGDKKKPWRYRWPDKVRDEVLARLLDLNAGRAREEARSSAAAAKTRGKKTGAKHASKTPDTKDLFS